VDGLGLVLELEAEGLRAVGDAEGASSRRPRPKEGMGDEHLQDPADAIGELADELLRLGAGLTAIVDHMARTAAAVESLAPGGPPIAEVLRQLLCEVLEPALAAREPHEILSTVALLGEARDTIARDLFLVDVRPPRRQRQRRRGGGKRPRKR
jgi:hypothetical protein